MISKIKLDEKEIILRNPMTPNIFDIDSISLLIGINGSGKTRALCDIVNTFRIQNSKIGYKHSQVFNQENIPLSYQDFKKWGVIYFTSLPFRVDFKKSTRHFINASENPTNKNIANNLNQYHDIILDFNIEPKLIMKTEVNVRKILHAIIDVMIKGRDISYRKVPFSSELNKIKSLNEELSKNKNNNSFNKNEFINSEIDSIYKKTSEVIIKTLKKQKDELYVFCFFCYISLLIKKNKSFDDILRWFFLEDYNKYSYDDPIELYMHIENEINQLYNIICYYNPNIEKDNILDTNHSIIEFDYSIIEPSINNFIITKYFNIEIKNMSSGQIALLKQIGTIDDSIKKLNKNGIRKILLLIDEGDAFLHLDWQRKYIYTLNKILSRIKKSQGIETLQLILATHSPILATDIPKEFICRLGKNSKDNISGFSAPLYQLLDESFDTKTIGQFSSEKINQLIGRIKNNVIEDSDHYIIEQIDNSLIKNELENLIKQKRK